MDQGTQTELDPLEMDDDDYQTTDSDEDDQIIQKVKGMEANLNKGGKVTKTWNFVKRLVSKEKNRYQYGGYDFDMSYILPNVIAMGFPAIGTESLYRNSMTDIKRFFNNNYGYNYKIYNLCTEKQYNSKEFAHCSQDYTFDDHNPPRFDLMLDFCKDIHTWLS